MHERSRSSLICNQQASAHRTCFGSGMGSSESSETERRSPTDPNPERSNETPFPCVIVRSRERANAHPETFHKLRAHARIPTRTSLHDCIKPELLPRKQSGPGGRKRSFADPERSPCPKMATAIASLRATEWHADLMQNCGAPIPDLPNR